jgi:hypothetical protein
VLVDGEPVGDPITMRGADGAEPGEESVATAAGGEVAVEGRPTGGDRPGAGIGGVPGVEPQPRPAAPE